MVLNIDFRHLASDFNELREPFINYNNCIVIATYSYLSFVIWPIFLCCDSMLELLYLIFVIQDKVEDGEGGRVIMFHHGMAGGS